MAEQETTRLYSMLDRVSEEQRTLLTSVSALKEQVRKIEVNDELQITEIGNLKLSLGTTTASMQYLTEQINEISDQRSKLMSAVDSAKESARQVASFEAVCNEKFTNIHIKRNLCVWKSLNWSWICSGSPMKSWKPDIIIYQVYY